MTGESDLVFVDTNLLVYSLDRKPSDKQRTARVIVNDLMANDRIRVSTQVLQELFFTLTHKTRGHWSVEDALVSLDVLSAWPLFITDYRAVREAALLCRDSQMSFWDALIVVAASRSGASRLYTEDLNDGQTILGVEVVNPFQRKAR